MNDSIQQPLTVSDYAAEGNTPPQPAEQPPMTEEPIAPPAKKRRRILPWILIPLCCLLALAIIGAGVFAFWYTRPEVVLKGGVYNYFKGVAEEYPVFDVMADTIQKGKIQFGISGEALVGEGKMIEKPLSFDLYSHVAKNKAMIRLSYDGKETSIYQNNKEFLVAGGYVGDSVLRVEAKQMYQQFTNSVFAPSAGNSYVFSLNSYEMESLEALLNELEASMEPSKEEQTNYVGKYLDLVIDSLEKHSTATMERIDGVQTNTYVFTPDQLTAYVDEIFKVIEADMEELNSDALKVDLSALGQEGEMNTEDLLSMCKIALTEPIEAMKQHGQTVTLTVVTAMYPHALERITYSVSPVEDRFIAAPTYEFIVDEDHNTQFTRTRFDQEDLKVYYGTEDGLIEFYIEQKDISAQKMVRTVDINLVYDDEQSYNLRMGFEIQGVKLEFAFSGAILASSKDSFAITLDKCGISVSANGRSESSELQFGLSISFYEGVKMPEFPEATADFLSMSIADVTELEKNSDFKAETLEKWLKDYLKQYSETTE